MHVGIPLCLGTNWRKGVRMNGTSCMNVQYKYDCYETVG